MTYFVDMVVYVPVFDYLYIAGWQERWFILDNGILSYYKSQDDVNTGCKGSVKMSVCDISGELYSVKIELFERYLKK